MRNIVRMAHPTPAEIEARARDAGLTVQELCDGAGIHRWTFMRWLNGKFQPKLVKYEQVLDALERAEAQKADVSP